jgi:hypothetical protein
LDALACFFDFDGLNIDDISTYIEPLNKRVLLWRQLWSRTRPPELTMHIGDDGKVTIQDTRPGQKAPHVEFSGLAAAVYTGCEEINNFEAISSTMAGKWGAQYPGNPELLRILDHMVDNDLMLHEDGRYLSLAVQRITVADVSEAW